LFNPLKCRISYGFIFEHRTDDRNQGLPIDWVGGLVSERSDQKKNEQTGFSRV
jgi:hypothetical protein